MKKGNRANSEQLKVWATTIRKDVVQMVARHGQGYVQQGLGAADLFTYLYFQGSALTGWMLIGLTVTDLYYQLLIIQRFLCDLGESWSTRFNKLNDYCSDGTPFEINASEKLAPFVGCVWFTGQGCPLRLGSYGSQAEGALNVYLMLVTVSLRKTNLKQQFFRLT